MSSEKPKAIPLNDEELYWWKIITQNLSDVNDYYHVHVRDLAPMGSDFRIALMAAEANDFRLPQSEPPQGRTGPILSIDADRYIQQPTDAKTTIPGRNARRAGIVLLAAVAGVAALGAASSTGRTAPASSAVLSTANLETALNNPTVLMDTATCAEELTVMADVLARGGVVGFQSVSRYPAEAAYRAAAKLATAIEAPCVPSSTKETTITIGSMVVHITGSDLVGSANTVEVMCTPGGQDITSRRIEMVPPGADQARDRADLQAFLQASANAPCPPVN